jgi:hypothetical protein
MTQETRCPACGAPLVYSGGQAVLRCTFCGTDLKISEEDGQAQFRVVAQPEPQKDILNQPLEGIGGRPGGAQVYPQPSPAATPYTEMPLPAQPVSSGAAIYPVSEPTGTKRSVSRWVWVGIALLVGLVLLCACAALVVLYVFQARVN